MHFFYIEAFEFDYITFSYLLKLFDQLLLPMKIPVYATNGSY